jgi:hypothetical protein
MLSRTNFLSSNACDQNIAYLALLLVGPAGLSIAQEPDLFPVDKNGKTGYIDQTGKLIIPFQFDEAWAFSEGLAPVRIGEDWGYIDASGKIVIKPRFFQASAFSQGFAAVGVYFPRKKILTAKWVITTISTGTAIF